jgi:pimeloyl-ACP methyl ester carboxylesterase
VVGHSLGGLVACRALALGPLAVLRLVLEDVGVPHRRPPATPTRPEGALRFDWAVVEQVRPEIDSPAAHWPKTFASVAVPTLVVGGGPSSFVPQEHVAELAGLLPAGSRTTLDTGHEVHATRPAEFLAVVRAFLDRAVS